MQESGYAPSAVFDYEGSYPWGFSGVHGPQPTIVDSGDTHFPKAARFTINDEARASWDSTNVRRSEMVNGDQTVIGTPTTGLTQWWAGTTWFPTNLVSPTPNPDNGGWLFWQQWHAEDPSKDKPLVFNVPSGYGNSPILSVSTQSGSFNLGPVPTNRQSSLGNRVDWKMKVLWSTSSSTGRLSFWVNDILKVDNQPCQTLVEGYGVYIKQGGYGNRYSSGTTPEPTVILHHTGLRYGSTEASITPPSSDTGGGNTANTGSVNDSSLVDDFSAQDNLKWTYSPDATTTSGQLTIAATTAYPSISSSLEGTASYDLSGKRHYIEFIQPPNLEGGATNCQFMIRTSQTRSGYRFLWSNNELHMQSLSDGAIDAGAFTAAYDSIAHRWLAISEYQSTIYFEVSSDIALSNWQTLHTMPLSKPLTQCHTYVSAGLDIDILDAGISVWDNYNAPAEATGPTLLIRSTGETWERRKLMTRNADNTGWEWVAGTTQ